MTTTILPLVPLPEFVENAAKAGILVIEMDCDPEDVAGSLVRLDGAIDNKVDVAIDNLVGLPIIGRIRNKLTATRCEVTLKGVIEVLGVPRGRVWLSDTGTFATVKPASGYIQDLGYSFGNGQINLDPTNVLTLQS